MFMCQTNRIIFDMQKLQHPRAAPRNWGRGELGRGYTCIRRLMGGGHTPDHPRGRQNHNGEVRWARQHVLL